MSKNLTCITLFMLSTEEHVFFCFGGGLSQRGLFFSWMYMWLDEKQSHLKRENQPAILPFRKEILDEMSMAENLAEDLACLGIAEGLAEGPPKGNHQRNPSVLKCTTRILLCEIAQRNPSPLDYAEGLHYTQKSFSTRLHRGDPAMPSLL